MYTQFARVIARRIERGDYTIGGLPSEEAFAEEIGASRKTARRALLELMNEGLLIRKPHGRLEINREHVKAGDRYQLALLMPAYPSWQYENWTRLCDRFTADIACSIRTVNYVHWDDPVILNALNSYDGLFLIPSSEKISTLVLKRLQRAAKLVVLDGDFSSHGIVSLKMNPPRFIRRIGDYLYQLGHRRIDCLNTQPGAGLPIKRLEQWKIWCSMRDVNSRIIDDQVQPYSDPTAHAYHVMSDLLDAGGFNATALVCLTQAAATGAIRALSEHGVRVGRDVSVAAVDGHEEGRYLTPARTALQLPSAEPYLEKCLQWMTAPRSAWQGSLLLQPSDLQIFVGESTGPAPGSATPSLGNSVSVDPLKPNPPLNGATDTRPTHGG